MTLLTDGLLIELVFVLFCYKSRFFPSLFFNSVKLAGKIVDEHIASAYVVNDELLHVFIYCTGA